jgi:hypothetical protein
VPFGARIVVFAAGVGLAATNGLAYFGGLEDLCAVMLIGAALFAPRPQNDQG